MTWWITPCDISMWGHACQQACCAVQSCVNIAPRWWRSCSAAAASPAATYRVQKLLQVLEHHSGPEQHKEPSDCSFCCRCKNCFKEFLDIWVWVWANLKKNKRGKRCAERQKKRLLLRWVIKYILSRAIIDWAMLQFVKLKKRSGCFAAKPAFVPSWSGSG